MLTLRAAQLCDHDDIWLILEPVIRAGDTYPLPRDLNREDALRYWFSDEHEVFVLEEQGAILGTYFWGEPLR